MALAVDEDGYREIIGCCEGGREDKEKLKGMKLPEAASRLEKGIEDTIAYRNFPREHWVKIRTNNGLERIMREIRRRTRVVGSFPDGKSL